MRRHKTFGPILRTPESQFNNLPDFNYKENYISVFDCNIHYIDEGSVDSKETLLCLHGEPSWSFLYRKMIPSFSALHRTICMDFIGFGKSDKFASPKAYTYQMHYDTLRSFIEQLDIKNITLIVQDWGGLIGLSYATEFAHRIKRLVIMNTGLPSGINCRNLKHIGKGLAFLKWQYYAKTVKTFNIGGVLQYATTSRLSKDVVAAYNAPFPEEKYKVGARIWPSLVPTFSSRSTAAKYMKRAKKKLKNWEKPALILFSDKDPVTKGQRAMFNKLMPQATLGPLIKHAGHFLQEDKGEEIAEHILHFIKQE